MEGVAEVRKKAYRWVVPASLEAGRDNRAAGAAERQAITIRNHARPRTTAALLVVSDVVAILLAAVTALLVRGLLDGAIGPKLQTLLALWPGAFLFTLAFAIAELYPGTALMPPEEIRRIVYAITSIFIGLGAALFMTKAGDLYSRGAFVAAWVLAILFVPAMRTVLRGVFASRPWWGQAAIVLGAGITGAAVVRRLKRNPRFGLKPLLVLDDNPANHGTFKEGVPVVGGLDMAPKLREELRVRYAIVAMPELSRAGLLDVVEQYCRGFPHQIVIPDLAGFSSLSVARRDMDGYLGLEVKQQLLLPGPRLLKRALDVALVALLAVPVALVTGLIALLIKLDSAGPVFYGQERIGPGGRPFMVWKFRTMIWNADKVLREYLEEHPGLHEEWQRDHKLRNDPRITRLGRILRRTSLDELPQFWNVVKGEMSVVGPRPIVQAEALRYGARIKEYVSVRPGITGLWQVSGRNDTGYTERIALDSYYVRNWSPWLDLYILVKTIGAVVSKNGAY